MVIHYKTAIIKVCWLSTSEGQGWNLPPFPDLYEKLLRSDMISSVSSTFLLRRWVQEINNNIDIIQFFSVSYVTPSYSFTTCVFCSARIAATCDRDCIQDSSGAVCRQQWTRGDVMDSMVPSKLAAARKDSFSLNMDRRNRSTSTLYTSASASV